MEKKASITISTKSWHYKLMLYVFRNIAPTPENMHNLCPYFWLSIASMFLVVPVFIVRVIIKIFKLIDEFIMTFIAWGVYRRMNDDTFYYYQRSYFNYDEYIRSRRKIRKMRILDENILAIWFEKNHGFKIESAEYEKWLEEYTIEEKETKPPSKWDNISERMINNIEEGFDKVSEEMSSWSGIIKWTKRFVSLLISTFLLIVTYLLVSAIGWSILGIINLWNMETSIIMGKASILLTSLVIVYYITKYILEYLKAIEFKSWWISALIFIIKIPYNPLKFILYNILYQIIIVAIVIFIKNTAIGFWNGILSFGGIFGDHLGSQKTDLCLGLDWETDEDDPKEKKLKIN